MFCPILHLSHCLFARLPASRQELSSPASQRRGLRLLLACLALLLSVGLLPTAALAQAHPASGPQGMPPHPRLEEKIKRGEVRLPATLRDQSQRAVKPAAVHAAASGSTQTINVLAIQVDFSDQPHSSTIAGNYFDNLLFAAPVGANQRGSVRDYFSKVSYGQVNIADPKLPSTIGWQRAPQTMSYYVGGPNESCGGTYPENCQKLAEDVLNAVDSQVDFSQYDNDHDGVMNEPVMLIHAGTGSEYCDTQTCVDSTIWSHSWSLYTPLVLDGVTIRNYVIMPEYFGDSVSGDMSIGVFAHEMGHGFWDLPDLYDRDNSSEGIGNWSLMASGSWNGTNPDGSSPAWPDAWSRIQMGFVTPTAITADTSALSLPQVAGNSQVPTVFKLRSNTMGSQEYFLLENRQRTSGTYDEYLPNGGLLIWHVDEARWRPDKGYQNDSECKTEPHSGCPTSHYLVALEQADGLREMENNTNRGNAGDSFPGSTNNRTWTGATNPENSSWYSTRPTGISVTGISNSGPTMQAAVSVSPLALSHAIYLPMLTKAALPAQPWTTIVSENFEGSFPGGAWDLFDDNTSASAEYYWARRNCQAASGSYSGWAVGGGADGGGLGCGSNYPDDADSWMVYGPFSLSGATAADLKFKYWLNLEEGIDKLSYYASTDGTNFSGYRLNSNTSGWQQETFDLSTAGDLGSLLGQPQVWIALRFYSDYSVNEVGGAYVDDVVLRKCTASSCVATQSPTNESPDSTPSAQPEQAVRVK